MTIAPIIFYGSPPPPTPRAKSVVKKLISLFIYLFFSVIFLVEIYANVIQGSLRVISNGGNGSPGQEGARGGRFTK